MAKQFTYLYIPTYTFFALSRRCCNGKDNETRGFGGWDRIISKVRGVGGG